MLKTSRAIAMACITFWAQGYADDAAVESNNPLISELTFEDQAFADCVSSWVAEEFNKYGRALEVKELSCLRDNIQSIKGIEAFTEILALDLANNSITDYSPLYALNKSLFFLNLWGNPISCEQLKELRAKLPRTWIMGEDLDVTTCS